MNQIKCATDWIGAYLEWTQCEWTETAASSPAQGGSAASDGDFTSAYLEWLDAGVPARAPLASARGATPARRASDVLGGGSGFHEAVLLAALHTESDCLHILRQILDGGAPNRGTVRLAVEALEYAHRLLDDERSAWRVLSALGGNGRRRSSDAWRSGLDADWPHALENVAADVQALTGKVLALHVH